MKKNKIACARMLILQALLQGCKLTAYEANQIGKTTAGARRIRQIREDYPVKKERVPGEAYCRYYFEDEFLAEWWKSNPSVAV